jgi:hypothetical protein
LATVNRSFEFVLHDSPTLAKTPDLAAFDEHFRSAGNRMAIEFSNLNNDAILVAPSPLGSHASYGHLAAFVRGASSAQSQSLWKLVGDAMQRRVAHAPVWLSTAGAGVPWLHIRLDNRPKYYRHRPYRAAPE